MSNIAQQPTTESFPPAEQLAVYRAMVMARRIDEVELELTNRGEVFFHVSGGGHEASAVLARHLLPDDWLHCHYRDKALMVARGVTPLSFMESLYCKHNSHSRGRQMSAHMSEPSLNVISISGPVGNSALHAVGIAAAVRDQSRQPIVLCSIGDGTTQEGEVLESFAEAARNRLPVLFLVEDNHWAISTKTRGETFYSLPSGAANSIFGMPIHHVDGRDTIAAEQKLGRVVADVRSRRQPQVVVFDVERLSSHTNADDQSIYRSSREIDAAQQGDPVALFHQFLLSEGVPSEDLEQIRAEVVREVREAQQAAARGPNPQPAADPKRPLPPELSDPKSERSGDVGADGLTMKDALRDVLHHHLSRDQGVILFGEDIEDPKGDVFGVTKGLSTEFPDQVKNSPLSEATIVGSCVGRALAGQRPVAFLQFADFLPIAYNQILCELASMYWRTDGGWESPVVVMVPCGGYRPGLGPFHSHSLESVMTHVPGIDVFMPSTASDAAGLLNAAFQSQRPSVFFYPKSCLNDPQHTTSANVDSQLTPIGVCRRARIGRDITFVTWGNTVRLCERVADALESVGVESEVIDLRSLSPWDERSVLLSAEKTKRLIVVHEDNQTCGFGAEVLATIAEKCKTPITMRRVTRPDTFIPCNFENQIELLPSFQRTLTVAAEILELDLEWVAPPEKQPGIYNVTAIGSGPSDESVTVVETYVREGDEIKEGDAIASLEATKSVFEFTSPVAGIVDSITVQDGDTIGVGETLLLVRTDQEETYEKPITQENSGTPILRRRQTTKEPVQRQSGQTARRYDVGMSVAQAVTGGRVIANDDELLNHISMNSDEVIQRTGIERRFWVGEDENVISLATKAAIQALEHANMALEEISLIVCSTTTPTVVTPSVACQVLAELSGKVGHQTQAYDINAACSGYLYGLQAAYDYLQSRPQARVMVLTTEVLSPSLNLHDPDTAILFGDAASATILYGEDHMGRARAQLGRPELSGRGENGAVISVPFQSDGTVKMKGQAVFREAVRAMISSLNLACQADGIEVADLDMIVPHQANQRIMDAIQRRLGEHPPVFSNIREFGNTSSTSIPLCLQQILAESEAGKRIGLCAFGGGFTFGGALLQTR